MQTNNVVRDKEIDWAAGRVALALGEIAGEIAGAWADHLEREGRPELSRTWRRVEAQILAQAA